jgi:hypothetical protein
MPPIRPPTAIGPIGWPAIMEYSGPVKGSGDDRKDAVRLNENRILFSNDVEKRWFSDNVAY